MSGILYILCYGEDIPFYVGRTRQTLAARLAGHKRDARDAQCKKAASEFARQQGIVESFFILEVCKEGELTEADIVRAATLDGHILLNATSGDSVVPKTRSPSTFSEINRQADERLDAVERRQRLHSDAQVLSKPEIVRQRVLGTIPSAEVLDALEWREAPIELLPWKTVPKNVEGIKCELLKFGDLLLYVAFKGLQYTTWIKNTRDVTCDGYRVSWKPCRKGFTRLQVLERVVAEFPKLHWWPISHRD